MSETIFSRIVQLAEQTPNAVAIEAWGRQVMSFSCLRDQLWLVIEKLHAIGVGRNDRVAIVLPNGPEMSTAFLGVAACATAAPLNPQYKMAEFEFFLSSLGAKFLLIQAGLDSPARSVARARGIPIAELHTLENAAAGSFQLVAEFKSAKPKYNDLAQADDVALVLHTSGTTSRPKTVPLTQRNLSASVRHLVESLKLDASDRCLHLLPQFHIGGLIDVLAAPLAAGGRVVCTPGFSVREFFNGLKHFQPTWSQAVPTMLQEIIADADEKRDTIERSSLRFIRSVSAPLPVTVMKEVERLFGVPVVEIFGMTETAGVITSNPLPPGERKSGSVGISAGAEVAIRDERGRLLEPQQTGEIVVRGENLMGGYENAPDENAAAFCDSWFRTGDLGYLDSDGYLFITGRVKEIINRGGEKISPREVDESLLSHPAVAEAASFAVPHSSLGEDIAGAVVLKNGQTLSKQDLIAFLAERLAYYKVPRTLHFVETIPKGPGGKLQRMELARMFGTLSPETPKPRAAFVEAETPVAKLLVKMWSEALKVSNFGIHDDFFDLGGDSLKAATFINELQRNWGDTVYVSAVFDAPTIAKFESYLQRHYPELTAKILGKAISPTASDRGRLESSQVARMRQSIARVARSQDKPKDKNRSAVFVLSPPRSGSTLLRVMLGGNPRLFAPPELYLLSFDNLAERKAWFSGSQRFQLEGNIRALMQLKNIGPEDAQSLMQQLEEQRMPTQDYYRMVQECLGPRILVDKTPFYAAHSETLQRAERYFENSIYIYLLRHPYGVIRSFEEAKLEQLWYPRLVGTDEAQRVPCPYGRPELAEMIWLILHRNILNFLDGIPSERQYRIRFEDMVADPKAAMEDVCRFLDLPFDPQMLQPQSNRRERMTDGVYPESRMIGDMKFDQHEKIDRVAADRWTEEYENDFLTDETWEIASLLGYHETLAGLRKRTEFEL